MNEVNVLRMLNHRNIIAIKGHCSSASSRFRHRYFIFLELASGGELNDLVAELGGLSETSARTYFAQMVEAVTACHDAAVAHRDLKLENWVLSTSGKVKLIDFGLAHVYS